MSQIETAARMAGEWWAQRLADKFADRRAAFAKAVESRVLQELRGECYWDWWGERHEPGVHAGRCDTEVDYDPMFCLVPAAKEVLSDLSPTDAWTALPSKHDLRVYVDHLEPKEGYGNWTPHIPVPNAEGEHHAQR